MPFALYPDWSIFLAAGLLADAGAYKGAFGVGDWSHTKAFWEFQVNSLLNSQRTVRRCEFLFSHGVKDFH